VNEPVYRLEEIEMPSEPICIRRAATVEEAEIILAWLDERGVMATIFDPSNPGVAAFGVTDLEGVAICVKDQGTADLASTFLREHDLERATAASSSQSNTSSEIICDECGKTVTTDPSASGSTFECPHCGAFVDAPGEGELEPS